MIGKVQETSTSSISLCLSTDHAEISAVSRAKCIWIEKLKNVKIRLH